MTQVVTYANNKAQCFCQIKFDSGERILVSLTGPPLAGIKIIKLTMFGLIPSKTLWEFSTNSAGTFEAYIHGLNILFPEIKHPIDSFKELLLTCASIEDTLGRLSAMEKKVNLSRV